MCGPEADLQRENKTFQAGDADACAWVPLPSVADEPADQAPRLKPSKLSNSAIETNFSQPFPDSALACFLPNLGLMVLGLQPDRVQDQINKLRMGRATEVERERERESERQQYPQEGLSAQ